MILQTTVTSPFRNTKINNYTPFHLFAGPCQVETKDHALFMAEQLVSLTDKLNIPFIFKASFDKANRSSIAGKRGIGLEQAMSIFEDIKLKLGCPIITDVHTAEQCEVVAKTVDFLQIPAFLARQTDLLLAAAKTNKPILVKKGQFMAPSDMVNVIEKIESQGNHSIMLCERGSCFGYHNLVVDMRGLEQMKETGKPVIMDATHAVQAPSSQGGATGGDRKFVPTLMRAALAIGVAGLFIETHDNPDSAPSDGANMIALDKMPTLLSHAIAIDQLIKNGDFTI